MPEFKGTIRLEDGDSLETTMTVESRRLVVKAGAHEIGNWSISELSTKRRNSQFRIKVEGEELVVDVADPIGVANALDVKADESKGRRGKKPSARRFKRKERPAPEVKPSPAVAAAAADPVFVPEPPPVVAAAAAEPVFVPEPPPVVAPAAAVADAIFFGEPDPAVAPPAFVSEPPPVVAPAAPDTIFFGEPEPAVAPPVIAPEPPPVVAPAAAVAEPVLFAEPEPEPVVVPAAVMPPAFVPEPAPVVTSVAVVAPPGAVSEPASGVAAVEGETVDTEPSLWQRTPMRTKLIGLGAVGFIIFFFVAPSLLALVLMLAGVATLFLAIAAKNESGSGLMPPPFFATNTAIAGGLGSVLLAMVIMVIT